MSFLKEWFKEKVAKRLFQQSEYYDPEVEEILEKDKKQTELIEKYKEDSKAFFDTQELTKSEPPEIDKDDIPPKTEEIEIEFPKEEDDKSKEDEPELTQEQLDQIWSLRIDRIMSLVNAVMGGVPIDARVKPFLSPSNWKTTSLLTEGQIRMIQSLLMFASQSPYELRACVTFCENEAYLSLSKQGYAIEKSIDLGRALTQVGEKLSNIVSPDKSTEGMKTK